ncbi:hypothetical protein [Haliscomenobacter sp.]|uniref:hypothetical protein n=1 Tax=Haliscomenobacter sp. TaxID=2717303 RepID=UPI003BAA5818
MENYSIDIGAENIYNSKTKGYFKEILESYHNGNYRATIVMLYTIVICDLVYKLQELKEIYNDDKAIKILNEVEETQNKNPKSPDWEVELIKKISERTTFFEISTHENVLLLQKHRHLSAHPVMDKNYELYTPNKETTRAHLRNMLEDILTKPPLVSNDVFNELINDISEKREYFPPQYNNIEFERYILGKYLNNAPKSTIYHVFKSIWKLTFRLIDEKCSQNRDINYNALFVMFKKYKEELLGLILKDKPYFSKIEKGPPCQFLISFISIYPEIFPLLEEHAKIIIRQEASIRADYKVRAWYLEENLKQHIKVLRQDYDKNPSSIHTYMKNLSYLVRDTEEFDGHEDLIDFLVHVYGHSRIYREAEIMFAILIKPYLNHFTLNNFTNLLNKTENNIRLHKRSTAFTDNSLVMRYIEEKYKGKINLDEYPNFVSSTTQAQGNEDLPF